jgi:hypothetical protein
MILKISVPSHPIRSPDTYVCICIALLVDGCPLCFDYLQRISLYTRARIANNRIVTSSSK